jgi:hypothetical protein
VLGRDGGTDESMFPQFGITADIVDVSQVPRRTWLVRYSISSLARKKRFLDPQTADRASQVPNEPLGSVNCPTQQMVETATASLDTSVAVSGEACAGPGPAWNLAQAKETPPC